MRASHGQKSSAQRAVQAGCQQLVSMSCTANRFCTHLITACFASCTPPQAGTCFTASSRASHACSMSYFAHCSVIANICVIFSKSPRARHIQCPCRWPRCGDKTIESTRSDSPRLPTLYLYPWICCAGDSCRRRTFRLALFPPDRQFLLAQLCALPALQMIARGRQT